MSALEAMSALPPKADKQEKARLVCFVPKADKRAAANEPLGLRLRGQIGCRGWMRRVVPCLGHRCEYLMGGEAMASAKELLERLTIREIVENWALLRDARRQVGPYGHPRAEVPQYGRRYHREGTIMKRLSMIGIVGGAALLAAVPLSLQWSQVGPAVPLLRCHTLMHSIMDPTVGTFAGSIVEPTDVPTEDILPPTEDILPPILPPTEDILPASANIPVRFTVGIVISAKLSHLACPHRCRKR